MSGDTRLRHKSMSHGSTSTAVQKQDGLAAGLSTAALQLFAAIVEEGSTQMSKPVHRELERWLGFLRLWCDGYDLASGGLDEILAGSRRLRTLTHRRLVSLCRTLVKSESTVFLQCLCGRSQHRSLGIH